MAQQTAGAGLMEGTGGAMGANLDIEGIPGVAKPANPQTYGASLAAFAAALTQEDRDSFAAFFQGCGDR